MYFQAPNGENKTHCSVFLFGGGDAMGIGGWIMIAALALIGIMAIALWILVMTDGRKDRK